MAIPTSRHWPSTEVVAALAHGAWRLALSLFRRLDDGGGVARAKATLRRVLATTTQVKSAYVRACVARKRTFRIRSPPHGGGAARCWRAVDRGADSAATPSPAARRVASSAPKQTRARGAAAAAKTSTSTSLLFSSRLVAGAHARDVRPCRRVRSAKDDSNREPVGAAAARGGKRCGARFTECC